MYKKLKEISNLIGGYSFKSNNYVNAGLRVVRIANVQDGYFSDESPCYYPLDIQDTLGDANLQDGDLLMSLTGNVGRVAILPKEALPAGLNQRVQCIRTDNMTKKYLYYFFKSQKIVHDAIKNSTGIAQLNLSTTWLSNYHIPYFAREKMNYIVNELDKISIVIDKEHNNLIKIDELIKSRFNEMFKHYDKVQLFKVATIVMGQSPDSRSYNDVGNGMPFFQRKADYGEKYTKVRHWTTEPSKVIEKKHRSNVCKSASRTCKFC